MSRYGTFLHSGKFPEKKGSASQVYWEKRFQRLDQKAALHAGICSWQDLRVVDNAFERKREANGQENQVVSKPKNRPQYNLQNVPKDVLIDALHKTKSRGILK